MICSRVTVAMISSNKTVANQADSNFKISVKFKDIKISKCPKKKSTRDDRVIRRIVVYYVQPDHAIRLHLYWLK